MARNEPDEDDTMNKKQIKRFKKAMKQLASVMQEVQGLKEDHEALMDQWNAVYVDLFDGIRKVCNVFDEAQEDL